MTLEPAFCEKTVTPNWPEVAAEALQIVSSAAHMATIVIRFFMSDIFVCLKIAHQD
jgi:hypothetical protein